MNVGRPSQYEPEYCERVIELGRQGKSPAQIASELGVVRQTLYNWAGQHPEFLAALTRAKIEEQRWWEDIGQSALFADKFQAQVWAKSMQARFRDDYTERQKIDANVNVQKIERVIVDPVKASDNASNSDG